MTVHMNRVGEVAAVAPAGCLPVVGDRVRLRFDPAAAVNVASSTG